MNKNEFLRELENSLKSKLSLEDINEVLSDYSDIFDNGIFEGKSEDEISNEIGSPANISRTILDDINNDTKSFESIKTHKLDNSNLASMSKRLGAYIIDTFATSLIFALIFFLMSIPFYSVTTTSRQEIVISESIEVSEQPINKYKQSTTMKGSEVSKIELYDNGEKIFKGTSEEFDKFLINESIDSNDITTFETVKNMPFDGRYVYIIFSLTLIFMIFGFSNIFTAFELWIFKGYTLGKWLTKIRVERIDGNKITFGDAFVRDALIKSIGNTITSGVLNTASFIWGCATPEHKTVQDIATKTKVVNVVR